MSGLPDNAICFFTDGDKLCAVFTDFKNIMESPIGFGSNFDEALDNLQRSNKGGGGK